METLLQLWELAKREADDENWGSFFGEIGLLLQYPLATWNYSSTPVNTVTFASTGGDGVHYGMLCVENQASESSPIVMTVPMNFGTENWIVGANLREFLCLGCRGVYFSLEQLLYDWNWGLRLLHGEEFWRHGRVDFLGGENAPAYSVERQRYLLALLNTELALHPLDAPAECLKELNERYLPLLDLAPKDI